MYPDFLVIGAQKAGTTWLDRALRRHLGIWLPPEKEIHYFDLPRLLPFAALLLAPTRSARHWAKARLVRDWEKVRNKEQTLSWYSRYYFRPRTDRWYASLFTPGAGQTCGETTPLYAILPEQKIRHIQRLMPGLKIVYILRDPIDRMWSDAAMFQSPRFGGNGMEKASTAKIHAFLSDQSNLRHSRYAENLDRWERFFAPSQICLIFQNDIECHPTVVIRAVTDFLEVAPARVAPEVLNRRVNSKKYPPPDAATEEFLAQELLPDLQVLARRTPNQHTRGWLERAERLAASSSVV